MKGLVDTIEEGILSGKVTTFEQYFIDNPQSVYHNSANLDEKAVMINGQMIVIGSDIWKSVAKMVIYHDILLGGLRILYPTNRSNIKRNNDESTI